jgi:hypothetical protein
MARQVNVAEHNEAESFRAWTADFDRWPESWMGVEEDLVYGRKLLPWFAGFLQALHTEGLSRKTFTPYRDNLWLLGFCPLFKPTRTLKNDSPRKLRGTHRRKSFSGGGFLATAPGRTGLPYR